jgi:hypothetical protein
MSSTLCKLLVALALSVPLLQAQVAAPLARHPGDVIKYRIMFDGPNADKITRLSASLGIDGPVPKDQAGFSNNFNANTNAPVSPKTFDVELKVPDNIANGDYVLSIQASASEGYGNYRNGQEFTVPPVHIENPKKFTPPGVKVTPLP